MATTSSQQTTIPTLYHLSSSQSIRVLWALEELKEANGLQFKVKTFTRDNGLAPAELKKLYPLGKAPIVTIEPFNSSSGSTDGSVPTNTTVAAAPGAAADTSSSSAEQKPLKTLVESRLILLYLADNYGGNALWQPQNAESRERDTFFQEFANGSLRAKMDVTLIFDVLPDKVPFLIRPLVRLLSKPAVAIFMKDVLIIFEILEDALSETQPWFAGERLGLADINMSFSMDVADQRGYFDKSRFPKLAKWHRTCQERAAYKRAVAFGGLDYDLVNFT